MAMCIRRSQRDPRGGARGHPTGDRGKQGLDELSGNGCLETDQQQRHSPCELPTGEARQPARSVAVGISSEDPCGVPALISCTWRK